MDRITRNYVRGLTAIAFVALATGATVIGCADKTPAPEAGGEHAAVGDVRPDVVDVRPGEPAGPVESTAAYEPIPPAMPARPTVTKPLALADEKPLAPQPIVSETPSKAVKTDAPAADAGTTHVVKKGETLTAIAKTAYGDGRQWKKIAAANPSVIDGKLKIGQVLVVP